MDNVQTHLLLLFGQSKIPWNLLLINSIVVHYTIFCISKLVWFHSMIYKVWGRLERVAGYCLTRPIKHIWRYFKIVTIITTCLAADIIITTIITTIKITTIIIITIVIRIIIRIITTCVADQNDHDNNNHNHNHHNNHNNNNHNNHNNHNNDNHNNHNNHNNNNNNNQNNHNLCCRPECQFSKRMSTCATLIIFAFAVLVFNNGKLNFNFETFQVNLNRFFEYRTEVGNLKYL